jgi:ATP-dependent exoDNAse (exonuclease V) beta subunit
MDFFSMNWGASKGLDDFHDVCIILNKTQFEQMQSLNAQSMNQQTLKKLYVACTRAKGDIFFVKDQIVKEIARDGKAFR